MEYQATNLLTAYLLQVLANNGSAPFSLSDDAASVNSLMDRHFPGIQMTSGKRTPVVGLGTIVYLKTLAMASRFYSTESRQLPLLLNNINRDQMLLRKAISVKLKTS